MKNGKRNLIIGGVAALAITGIWLGTRKKSGETKRAEIKAAVADTAGEEAAANVDRMSDEEVATVYDTVGPGGSGGGGGGSSYVPASNNTPAAKSPTASIKNFNFGPAVKTPVVQSKAGAAASQIKKSTPTITPRYAFTSIGPANATVQKKGVGSVDATDCVAIFRKYGIL